MFNLNNDEILIIVTEENETIANEENTCKICDINFESYYNLVEHNKTLSHIMETTETFQCEKCGKKISKTHLEEHYTKHKREDPPNFECRTCQLTFESKHSHKSHLNSETHENNLKNSLKAKCQECHKHLDRKYIKNHIKFYCAGSNNTKRRCPICLNFLHNTYYKYHMNRIHNLNEIIDMNETEKDEIEIEDAKQPKEIKSIKNYVCDRCGKVFRKSYSLKLHIMTHGNELKYKCMFCPYRGLHEALLKIHVRTHMGDYNYKCAKCPARFTTKSNLNKHLRRHGVLKDFKCEKCNKCFYSKLSVERHNYVDHLGIKDHICNICGMAFGYRNNMMTHQLKVHKREKITDGKGHLPNYLKAQVKTE